MLSSLLTKLTRTILSTTKNTPNHYQILGVSRTATSTQIKTKYYQLAKLYHPDVCQDDGNSTLIFNQISQAYEILTNQKKRKQYDHENPFHSTKKDEKEDRFDGFTARYRSQKQKQAKGQHDDEPFMAYHEYFKKNRTYAKSKRGADININLTITLQESIIGVKKQVKYSQQHLCDSCFYQQKQICFTCGGKKQIFNRIKRQKQQCESCQGRGYKNQCESCSGTSYVMKDVTQNINLTKNIHHKNILRFEGLGHHGYRSNNGDLYLTILIQQSQNFKIDGNNIHSQHQLDYLTAILGGKIKIKTVYGLHQINIQPGTQSGNQLRLFNYGLTSQYSKRKGDHIVTFKIKIPQHVTQKQRQLLAQLNL